MVLDDASWAVPSVSSYRPHLFVRQLKTKAPLAHEVYNCTVGASNCTGILNGARWSYGLADGEIIYWLAFRSFTINSMSTPMPLSCSYYLPKRGDASLKRS